MKSMVPWASITSGSSPGSSSVERSMPRDNCTAETCDYRQSTQATGGPAKLGRTLRSALSTSKGGHVNFTTVLPRLQDSTVSTSVGLGRKAYILTGSNFMVDVLGRRWGSVFWTRRPACAKMLWNLVSRLQFWLLSIYLAKSLCCGPSGYYSYLVTLLSMSSNSSTGPVLKFSLITMSPSEVKASLHRTR